MQKRHDWSKEAELAHSPRVAPVHGGIDKDTVFRWKTSTSRSPRRLNALDEHQHFIHDLVKKRVPLVSSTAAKHMWTARSVEPTGCAASERNRESTEHDALRRDGDAAQTARAHYVQRERHRHLLARLRACCITQVSRDPGKLDNPLLHQVIFQGLQRRCPRVRRKPADNHWARCARALLSRVVPVRESRFREVSTMTLTTPVVRGDGGVWCTV